MLSMKFLLKFLAPVLGVLFVAEKFGVKCNTETFASVGQSVSAFHESLLASRGLIASLLSLGLPIVGAVILGRSFKEVKAVPSNTRIKPAIVWQSVAGLGVFGFGSFLLYRWLGA